MASGKHAADEAAVEEVDFNRVPTHEEEVRYQNIVFLKAVVPVLKPIIEDTPSLTKAFKNKQGVVQVSSLVTADDPDAKPSKSAIPGRAPRVATHFIFNNGEITVRTGEHEAPNVEIEFPSREALNGFFLGDVDVKALPKIRGAVGNVGLLVAFVRALLTMANLLGLTEAPEDPAQQALLTKCMFYLLSTGISQLNKAKHPLFRKWAVKQPDRVYEFKVYGRPDLGAYVRVKGGRSKAARGEYTRSKPFFAMAFDSPESALGILQDTLDMIEATVKSKLVMEGAPEYGAELGDLMFAVGDYAQKAV